MSINTDAERRGFLAALPTGEDGFSAADRRRVLWLLPAEAELATMQSQVSVVGRAWIEGVEAGRAQ